MTTKPFTHRGRRYQLFRRKEQGPWYLRLQTGGTRRTRSLATTQVDIALARAKHHIDTSAQSPEAYAHLLEKTALRAPQAPTIGQLIHHYRQASASHNLKPQTRDNAISSLRLILITAGRTGPVDLADTHALRQAHRHAEQLPLDTLDGHLVDDYRAAIIHQARDRSLSEPETQSRMRSANSALRKAASILGPALQAAYQRAGLAIRPHLLNQFINAPRFRGVGKDDYNPPSDAIIRKTFEDLPHLATQDPNAHAAIWLAIGLGLRKGDIAATRVDWFIQRDSHWYARGDALGKDGRHADLPVMFDAMQHLAPHLDRRRRAAGDHAHLLEGHATERQETVFRRISEWMATRGWETQKKIHEFRAWAGCQVAMQHDLLTAQLWMRHKSYAVTEKHYGRYIKLARVQTRLQIPDAPTLRILPDPAAGQAPDTEVAT